MTETIPPYRRLPSLGLLAVFVFVALATTGCVGGARSQYELMKFAVDARNDAKTAAVEARSMLNESEATIVAYKTAALDAKLAQLTETTAQRQGGVIYPDQARYLAKAYAADKATLTATRARRAKDIADVTRKISLAGDNIDALVRAEDARAQTAVALQEFAQSEFTKTAEGLIEFAADEVARRAALEAAQEAQAAQAELESEEPPPGEEPPPPPPA